MKLVCRLLALSSFVVIAMSAAHTAALAQPSSYEGLPVRNIQFDPRQQPVEAEELHDILPLQMNEPLRMSTVRASIERLFATGRYADIQVDAQPYRDGVAIVFITRAGWFLGDVLADGGISSPPSAGQLENASGLNLGQPFTEASVSSAVSSMRRLLEANGLFRANLRPVFDWETGREFQQVNIRFDINSGPRARFTTPVFTGDLKLDFSRILSATGFRRWVIHTWKPMTQTRVRQALENVRLLYQKENRLEARVLLESIDYDSRANRAIPTLRIEAGPRIEVRTIGAKVSPGRLRRYIPIYEEHAVDRDLLVEGARNLRDYFQSSGYFEAEVVFKEQSVINDKASIDYLINTGRRHRLARIDIQGNSYFPYAALRERMYLRTASFLQFPQGRFSESLLRRDKDSISSLYQSNGFRDVEVTHRTEENYGGKPGDLRVELMVREGQQYFVNSLDVRGAEHLDLPSLLGRLSSVAGQPFSEFNVAVDRDTILQQYFERGFPNATFEWSFKPAALPNRVDLRFTITEGTRQFVRQVLIGGNEVTSSNLINRSITLNPGDPLSPTQLTEMQRRLYALGVFARVDTAIQNPDGESNRKYVLYNVTEARRYSLAVGFGAELGRIGGCQACFESPGGATGFSPRVSLDVTRNNLWGIAHSLSLRTRVSNFNQRALLNYSWPRFLQAGDKYTLSFTGLYESSRDVRTFNYRRQEAAVQLNQRLTKATTIFYRAAYRRVGVSDLKVTPFLIPQLSQPVRVGMLSLNAVHDRRDDPVEPHKGIYSTLDLGLADRYLGSQASFSRFLVRNATYHQLNQRFVLARSTEFGDLFSHRRAPEGLDAIPLAERFFGGGGTSHRGFPQNQAGPRDTSTGFPLGGTALLFNQTEIRFPLIGENIGGVLYHDAGNIYSRVGHISLRFHQRDLQDFDYMVHNAGFGLRYRTPVGPLRVDLGYTVNPPRYFGFNGSQQDLINAGRTPCSPPDGVRNLCEERRVSHFSFFFSIGQTF
jgi:outer membrane protein insertion porin family